MYRQEKNEQHKRTTDERRKTMIHSFETRPDIEIYFKETIERR